MKVTSSGRKSVGKSFFVLFLLLLFICNRPCFPQADVQAMDRLVKQMDSLAKGEPPQLVYIQTSKGVYEPMEDLWFKAYLMDSQTFALSTICQTLYLQMLNENTKQVVWQEKYEVQNGFVDGHVYIHDTLSVGDYLLAAYTSYSFYGDSPEMKAVRRIQVREELLPNYDGWVEPAKTAVPLKQKERPIQFNTFPEGGNLIAGIPNRLAFKAVKPDGTPVEVRGALFEGPDTLITFNSEHDGMGSLVFTPAMGKEYTIRLSEPATDSTYILPEVYGEGISLQLVSRDMEFLKFKVSQSPSPGTRTVYLRGQVRGIVCCIARGELLDELTIKIPLKEFPFQGIAEFTLFDGGLVPIAERLVYVNTEKRLYVTTELDKERYETREKATLKITVKDENGQPVATNLGISIYDKLHQNQGDPLNILTYSYLTSQLRGRIYDPAYYFVEKNEDREVAMDLLMLTQGWRKYVWSGANLKLHDPKDQRILTDWVEGELSVKERKEEKTSLEVQYVKVYFPNTSDGAYFVETDSVGKFAVTIEHLEEGRGNYVYLTPLGPENLGLSIILSEPFQAIDATMEGKEMNYPLAGPIRSSEEDVPMGQYVEGLRIVELTEVTVTARGTTVFRDKYLGHLDSIAKYNITTDYVGECGILNCPAAFTKSMPVEGKKYVKWIGQRDPGPHPYAFKPDEMERIIYEYPKFTEEELMKMNNLSRTKAYYIHREFYQPIYDNTAVLDTFPDFRNTLLWSPLVVTDEKGEATVEFFCSDLNTGFVGTIEGISGDGLLCNESIEFSVIKKKTADREE